MEGGGEGEGLNLLPGGREVARTGEGVSLACLAGLPPIERPLSVPGIEAAPTSNMDIELDNADGALPIEYTEVTISRTMFRSGGSEYAINGSSARLLDVQDLLSDSGIGRAVAIAFAREGADVALSFLEEREDATDTARLVTDCGRRCCSPLAPPRWPCTNSCWRSCLFNSPPPSAVWGKK